MINVLFVGYGTQIGGIEVMTYNIIRNANPKDFSFSILAFKNRNLLAFESELKKYNVSIYYIESRRNYIKYLHNLKNVFQNNNFDIIHYNLMDLGAFERILYAKKYCNAKLIIHSHNAGFSNRFIKAKINHKIGSYLLRNTSYYELACGDNAGKFMFNNENYRVIHNGINLEMFQFSKVHRDEVRSKYNISSDDILIGLVARIEAQKNPLFLLDIFYEYHNMNPNSKLLFVGDGSLKIKVINKAREYGVEDSVLLIGNRVDAYKYYSAMDVYLMPSLYEGLSISLCEAQVNGLICFTSNSVDVGSNISNNVFFLSLENSAREWAECIYNTNIERDGNVVAKIPDEFDNKKSCEIIYSFYKEIVS